MNSIPPGVELQCGVCDEQLNEATAWPLCSKCKSFYHYKCVPGTIYSPTWRGMTAGERQEWLCTYCKAVSPARAKRSLDVSGDSVTSDLESNNKCMKFDENSGILDEISKLLDRKLQPINQLLLQFTAKIDDLTKEVTRLKVENADLRQYTRKNSALIQGLPKTDQRENPIELTLRFAKEVGYPLNKNDIDDAHRLPGKNENRPFLIKFVSRITKRDFVIHCKKKRELNASILGGSPNTRIYVNDHLTPETSGLFQSARLRLKPLGYVVTTRNCVVLVKDLTNNRFTTIRTEEDIENMVQRKAGSGSLNSTQLYATSSAASK